MKVCEKHNEIMVPVGTAQRLKCRSCNREHQKKWVAENPDKHKERNNRSAKNRRNKNRELYLSLFNNKVCVDCGEHRVPCLDFDHINPEEKLFTVSQGFRNNYSWSDIKLESEKCEIRCANCHRIKTAIDNNWYDLWGMDGSG